MQRHQRGLDGKNQQQERGCQSDANRVTRIDEGYALRHVGHVQRAGLRIEGPQRKEEERRADQVVEHVLHAGPQADIAAAVDHQAIGGDQQHFEEHEEVEEVPGQEGAEDTHQLELEQRMEVPPAIVPAGTDRVKQHEKGQHRRQQHHHRAQPVTDDDDAEGRGPVAELIQQDGAVRRGPGQPRRDGDQGQDPRHGKDALDPDMIPRGQHDEGGQQRRQDDGRDDPMGHVRSSVPVSGSISGSFTLSSFAPR